jgi:hypothetical protein
MLLLSHAWGCCTFHLHHTLPAPPKIVLQRFMTQMKSCVHARTTSFSSFLAQVQAPALSTITRLMKNVSTTFDLVIDSHLAMTCGPPAQSQLCGQYEGGRAGEPGVYLVGFPRRPLPCMCILIPSLQPVVQPTLLGMGMRLCSSNILWSE